ncbi:hypothetical protein [Clostridium perfringens]|uniref:hypothetical protein n=1 Tax=Clostridium perfringens TaxID=1502 RepID=UPI002A27B428|nr:hypothetical protein [Clostridium perfringens]
MRREELEAKLGNGEQLTREEANQLSFLLRKEEFLEESKKALTMEEVDLIKDITGCTRINNSTVMDLLLTLQEHTLGEVNPDFTEMMSLVIAKVQNILSLPELLAVNEEIDKSIDMKDNKAFKSSEDYKEFIINSYMPLTEDELRTMSNALSKDINRKNAKLHLLDIQEIAYESTWVNGDSNSGEEYTDKLNLIVSKLNNM